MVLAGSFTQDIRAVGSLEACAVSNASGASSWLEPTSFDCTQHVNLCFCHAHAVHCMRSSIPEKPGVPLTSQLVPPPQDCSTFRLVPECTWFGLSCESSNVTAVTRQRLPRISSLPSYTKGIMPL